MTRFGSWAWRLVAGRPWLTAVVVVVVGGAATGAALLSSTSGDSAAAATSTSRLVSVSTGTVSKSVSGTGTFAPSDEEDVSFPTSSSVTSVRVAQGDTVTKGQVLGTINALSLKAALATARVTLATARATLASAEDSSDSTSAELTADRAGVTTAKESVASAKDDLADATLRSPLSGVVAEVNVTKGEQSAGSSTDAASSAGGTSTGDTAASGGTSDTGAASTTATSSSSGDFVIIGTKKWTVSLDVDDTEVGLVKTGQQAQLTTDNVSRTVFGVVSSVSVLSSTTSGSASYPVVVSVTGSPSGLHDGASATIKIIYKQATNVLTVPSAAVHSTGSSSYVYLSSNGKKVKQTVGTGLTSGTTTQITSGLESGEQVYLTVTTPSGSGNSNRSGNSGSLPSGGNAPGGTGNGPGGGNFPGGGAPGGGS